MKTLYRTVFILCFSSLQMFSQNYHQPVEILKILNDSKISYQIDDLEITDVEEVKPLPEINHGFFVERKANGNLQVSNYGERYANNADYQKYLNIAEEAFHSEKPSEARIAYLKVLEIAPSNSQIMTFIGQTFVNEHNDSIASKWYQKAIDSNYYDYMAHWFLADVYEKFGDMDKALKEILIAKILNRNNPRLQDALERIFKSSGKKYIDWQFTPRYEVKSLGDNKVSIKYDHNHSEWLSYALCKAVWQFEPGYKESMQKGSKQHPTVVEGTECTVCTLIGAENSNSISNNKALQVAKKALNEKMFTEYVLYEVILPQTPGFFFYLQREMLDSISKYILQFRTE